jgi:hypothetical protein
MIIEIKAATSPRSGNQATAKQSLSKPTRVATGHLTFILTLASVAVALAWGLYESVQLLTGVVPKF